MDALSYLKQEDVNFLTKLLSDITNELCECDCCKKETGCSIFERMYVAANLLYKKVYEDDTSHSWSSADGNVKSLEFVYDSVSPLYRTHAVNMFDDESCIDWDSISSRIMTNSASKNRFVNKSRKKILSRFYYYLYNIIPDSTGFAASQSESYYVALTRNIFGSNTEDVIANCLDECCNQ